MFSKISVGDCSHPHSSSSLISLSPAPSPLLSLSHFLPSTPSISALSLSLSPLLPSSLSLSVNPSLFLKFLPIASPLLHSISLSFVSLNFLSLLRFLSIFSLVTAAPSLFLCRRQSRSLSLVIVFHVLKYLKV